MKKGKKGTAALLCAVLTLTSAVSAANAANTANTVDTGVKARDPFVLEYNGTYYMYATGLQNESGYGCVYSTDLTDWSEPVQVFTPPEDFDGDDNWWAPECHFYKGRFYLFATYHSAKSGKRGVAIFRADSPLGPFEIITDGHITPKDHDAIDGTLYVDEDGQPWMVYVGEWTSNADGVGDMMAAKLSEDITAFISEPILLFRGSDPRWARGKITDGPFLYKTKEGRLLMLWSNMNNKGYCVGIAYSSNGKTDGRWLQQSTELYRASETQPDGGHGMLFTAPDGTLTLSIHSPNQDAEENPTTALLIPVDDIGCTLVTQGKNNVIVRLFYRLYYAVAKLFARSGSAA